MKVNVKTRARAAKVARPKLTLEAPVARVRAGETIPVTIDLAGLDRVELELVPAGTFDLDLRSKRKPGIVRLKGLEDGHATLVARGIAGSTVVMKKRLDISCVGPSLQLLEFGYRPA